MKVLTFSLLLSVSSCLDVPCKSRDYGFGSTVCVCDDNYCDTISNPKLRKHLHNFTPFNPSQKQPNGSLRVDTTIKYQQIKGWGGAFTDSTGFNILSLGLNAQKNLLDSYFSQNGIEYNLCRVPLGGTDFSPRKYTYDDGDADYELNNFKLAPEDYKYKIPIIQRAKVINPDLKLFSGAWYSPDWMRAEETFFISPAAYQSWAEYFLKFLQSYRDENIEFWALSTGNEPYLAFLTFVQPGFVQWIPQNQSRWIAENLGPTLNNSNFSHVQLLLLDDGTNNLPYIPFVILSNPEARNFIDGIAIHWYFNTELTPLALEITRTLFPQKFLISTEASVILSAPLQLGSWDNAEKYATDILNDLEGHVTGWVDWNMALDPSGGPSYANSSGDAAIVVNATSGEFYKQPMFYILGHFSKFIPEGSYRVYVDDSVVDIAAFLRPDSSRALVFLNKNNVSSSVEVYEDGRGSFRINLQENSITTVVYW